MSQEDKDTKENTSAGAPLEKEAVLGISDDRSRGVTPASPVRSDRPRGKRRRSSRREDRRPEFDSKIVSIRRVTRVVAGGRRFSFSVALVAGDKKGRVGVGIGKASDTALAIEKAMRDAKKRMIRVPLSKEMRIPHEVGSKYCASVVALIPAPGRGIAAGSSVRTVLEMAGIRDVTGKILSRSKNQLNNARATVQALQGFNA
jgi:small subunit ribosomal protein S5